MFDYIKPEHQGRAKLCYMDTDSFVIHIKTKDFYEDIGDDVEKWFHTSNYNKDDNRLLLIGWNKKVISLVIDELQGRILKTCFGLRAKTYAYLMDGDSARKKS